MNPPKYVLVSPVLVLVLVHELPNDSVVCSKQGLKSHSRLDPLLSSPFFFVFAFLLHSMPRQNFSTRDISRYEWGATGTIFPSSCYPVSFFAVARPRDLSFAAVRFLPLSFSFFLLPTHTHTHMDAPTLLSSRWLPCRCSRCIIRAAKPFLDQLSRSTSLPGIFLLRARELRGPNLPRKRFESIYESIRDRSSRRSSSNFSRISDYPPRTSIMFPPLRRGAFRWLLIRRDDMFRKFRPRH